MNIVFFGSTGDSVIVADGLRRAGHTIVAVVTQPPKPIGRKQVITPTPVETYARGNGIPVHSFTQKPDQPWLFENNNDVVRSVRIYRPDLVLSASFGQKIPADLYRAAPFGGINIHPSLLPRWRGADPVPWTILAGDTQTGVTVTTLADSFDRGLILARESQPIKTEDLPDPLRTALFEKGTAILTDILAEPERIRDGVPQPAGSEPYAYKFRREDGFVPWPVIIAAMDSSWTEEALRLLEKQPLLTKLKKQNALSVPGRTEFLVRLVRAISPWPGVWTLTRIKNKDLRIKILTAKAQAGKFTPLTVQIEGKKPVSFSEFSRAHLN